MERPTTISVGTAVMHVSMATGVIVARIAGDLKSASTGGISLTARSVEDQVHASTASRSFTAKSV